MSSRWAFRVSEITRLAFPIAPRYFSFRRKGSSSSLLVPKHKFHWYRRFSFSTLVTPLHPVAFNRDQSKINGYETANPSSHVNWSTLFLIFFFPSLFPLHVIKRCCVWFVKTLSLLRLFFSPYLIFVNYFYYSKNKKKLSAKFSLTYAYFLILRIIILKYLK